MEGNNQYKNDFKYFKRKCPPPDFSKVLDISDGQEKPGLKKLEVFNHSEVSESFLVSALFLKPSSEWNVYEVSEKPGFIFISNPFTKIGQRYWIYQCLSNYTRRPNKLNIDAHDVLDKSQEWWETSQGHETERISLKKKLRWATMGYHHNWETKVYSESSKDPFPTDLAELSRYVSHTVGFPEFRAEAAIVNFYHFDSTLSGHTDHSEMDLSAPLFSFSFGQTAIFLLGGTSLDCASTPMYIKSGDIVIMSGYSRQCYHGIPKIVPIEVFPWDTSENFPNNTEAGRNTRFEIREEAQPHNHPCKRARMEESSISVVGTTTSVSVNELMSRLLDDDFWEPYQTYIAQSRINMNVRQVLCKDQKTLTNKEKL